MKIIETTLIIDKKKVAENISKILTKSKAHKTILRPHFKTHQSAEVGEFFRKAGIEKITVSSVNMALFFASHHWKNITIAFPFNVLEIEKINSISEEIQINLLVESIESLEIIKNKIKKNNGIYIEIDTGSRRTGVSWNDFQKINSLISAISMSEKLIFKGFLIHAGNTYHTKSPHEIIQIHNDNLKIISTLRQTYKTKFPKMEISYGDTPSVSIARNFEGIDELRPGNFVYYDFMQLHLQACTFNQIAAVVAAPIVAIYPERQEIVVHAGAVHLSKEYIIDANNEKTYGKIVIFDNNYHWSNIFENSNVIKLSQEHGTIKVNKESIKNFKIGQIIGIIPVHSCLTANLLKTQIFV